MTQNQRSTIRIEVNQDRAQITVMVNSAQHLAILADVSAGGFGVLLMKGVGVKVGQTVTVITDDSVFDCEVMHLRPDDTFQFVGLRRVKDLTEISLPPVLAAQSFSSNGFDFSPMGLVMFVGVALGFSGAMIGIVSFLGIDGSGSGGGGGQGRTVVTNVRELEKETIREIEKGATYTATSVSNIKEMAAASANASSQAAALMTGQSEISWNTLVSELQLSGNQQQQILGLTNSGKPATGSPVSRNQALSVLSEEQRARISRLMQSKPKS